MSSLHFQDTALPFITPGLPGIGGEIKREPEHFTVEEIPLYAPSGQGDHVYVRLSRSGWNTKAVEGVLADLFGLAECDVGTAGLKDKHARVTQTFSLNLPNADVKDVATRLGDLPFQICEVSRHRNKLKPGHLLGNRFRILVLRPKPEPVPLALAIAQSISASGVPNYYGLQRFGVGGENARRGYDILLGHGPRHGWLNRLFLSAFQSFLFNQWLVRRISAGCFNRVLSGDIAKKEGTGGLFEVTDAAAENERLAKGEISYTGPIFGVKMWRATGEAGKLEEGVLRDAGVTSELIDQIRLSGSRRSARILIRDLTIEPDDQGLLFGFSLPKGAYATTVLREFMKVEVALPEEP